MNTTSGTTRITYTIGEFSTITGLSIKTLRFYHEKRILVPSSVDGVSGYRYYDANKVEKARVIMRLRQMEFSIEDIAAVLADCEDEADILNQLERQKQFLQQRIHEDRDVVRSLNEIIARENAAKQLLERSIFPVKEMTFEPMLIAGIRMTGKYHECGAGFARLGKAIGRHICGKPLCLYYDGEYREDGANFEPCFPIRKAVAAESISIRELPGGKCLSLVHRGPYDQLGRSYAKILKEAKERQANLLLPSREVYLKGPGMIFKGNPKNYLTEIQLPVGA
jgi:DNA-binding transcriptional MerR regulator/effector-binding domain-containing protein